MVLKVVTVPSFVKITCALHHAALTVGMLITCLRCTDVPLCFYTYRKSQSKKSFGGKTRNFCHGQIMAEVIWAA